MRWTFTSIISPSF